MIDLEHELRRGADAARASAASALDIERDLAATLERAQSIGGVQFAVRQPRRPSLTAMAVAAALLVVVSIGAVLVLRDDNPRHHLTVTPPPETDIDVTPPPTSAVPDSTIAGPTSAPSPSTVPTVASTSSEPSTVETNSAATTGCFAGVPYDEAARMFVSAMLSAREAGSLGAVSGCLSAVPPAFTGAPPACWTACDEAPRIFAADSMTTGEALYPAGDTVVSAFLPVTYQTSSGYLDVSETWQMTPTDDGYVISDFAIQEPPFSRLQALDAITRYFEALAAHDWEAAAAILDDGAIEPENRDDLQRLRPDNFTVEGIAAALARWCELGCDTDVPSARDLEFTGTFGLAHGAERIVVGFYEGSLTIFGVPFQTPNAPTSAPVASVSYKNPPPVFEPTVFASTQLAPPPVYLNSGPASGAVAVTSTGVIIVDHYAKIVNVVDWSGLVRRTVPLRDVVPWTIVAGPADVIYGVGMAEDGPNYPEIVAIPLLGDRAGDVVARADAVSYGEPPPVWLARGPTGIVDRVPGSGRQLIAYVDAMGQALADSTVPQLPDLDSDNTVTMGTLRWPLAIERDPASPDWDGRSMPAPSAHGGAVYWTEIGPVADPTADVQVPTMPVIAALDADGTAQWWSIPDGWGVVASDEWGTVLAHATDDAFELALFPEGV